ncbi:MAG: endonuclease domain-containing protein [Solirubrobacteraceae bacterium]
MPPFVEVTVVTRARRSRPGLVIHETRRAPAIRTRHDLPVTAPPRTLTDLAATQPSDAVERACSEALVLQLVTEDELETAGLLTRQVAPARSELERSMLVLVTHAGLPRPRVNEPLGPYRVDFLWPQHRVIVETDGHAAHGRRAAFERDRARDADLTARGYAVLRFTWRQLRDEPLLVAARLAQLLAPRLTALARRAARAIPEPPPRPHRRPARLRPRWRQPHAPAAASAGRPRRPW